MKKTDCTHATTVKKCQNIEKYTFYAHILCCCFFCFCFLFKREEHRVELLRAATSGSKKFFIGTDSAPHAISAKQSICGCAGIFTAHAAIELYAEAFHSTGAIEKLEGFASEFGPDFYGLERNSGQITLRLESWEVPESYSFGCTEVQNECDVSGKSDNTNDASDNATKRVRPLRAGETMQWKIVSSNK